MNKSDTTTTWKVLFTRKAGKQKEDLPSDIRDRLYALRKELEIQGSPFSGWLNYGKIKGTKKKVFHCHLNKGHPTYVVVWEIVDKTVRIIEIKYAGTHEGVNYSNFT